MVRGFAQRLTAAHLALPADGQELLAPPLPSSHTWLVACRASWRRTLLALLVMHEGRWLLLLFMSVLSRHLRS